MIVVSDTSPITALIKIGETSLLSRLFGEVIIPPAVETELLRAHPALPTFLRIVPVQNTAEAARFRTIVDMGEAEAIQLAKELRADRLLIDDYKGRRLATQEGLRAIGLVGVILLAKSNGLIPAARPLLHRLQTAANVYLSQDVLDAALADAGEI